MKSKFEPRRLPGSPLTAAMAVFLLTLLALPAHSAIVVPPVPPSSGNGVPPNILFILDDSGSMAFEAMPMSSIGNSFKDRSYSHNTIYYNPTIDYQPWMTSTGARMTGGDSYGAVYSSFNYASGSTINLLDEDDREREDRNGSTPWVNGGTQTFYVPKDINNQDPDYLNERANFYRYQIIEETGRVQQRSYRNNGWRDEAYETPTGRLEAEERRNYAIWFSYHRTRMKVAKAGASEAFGGLDPDKYRVGFTTIWGPNGSGADNDEFLIPVGDDNGLFRGVNRDDWFDALVSARGYQGTPLRNALRRAGRYYENDTDDGPYGGDLDENDEQFQCRQNFSILTTDGFWNGGSPSNIGDSDSTAGALIEAPENPDGTAGKTYQYSPEFPYSGSTSVSLADVAMEYWKKDLRTDMANIVPWSVANPAFWQHMVTFGISIGLSGTLDQQSVSEVLADGLSVGDVARTTWPNPNTSTEDARRIDDLLHAAVNGHGEFVAATNPVAFADGLKAALGAINSRTSSASNVAASSTSLSTETKLFQARYIGGDWTGEVSAYAVDTDGIGADPMWNASEQIPATRNIFTTDAAGTVGPFPTSAQNTDLGSNGIYSIADYIRGSDAGEMDSPGPGSLRNRVSLLGDIVHSSPYYVKDTDTLYVGSNDGMLHGFGGSDGVETFAYIPRGVSMTQLRNISSLDYAHRYFVDGPVVVSDRSLTSNAHPAERNVLVGTLGRGGKGVFALDVTDPASFGSQDVLFDIIGDADMGLVTGQPILARLNDGSVSAIFGNGINSENESAVLWVVDVDTGDATKIDTGAAGNNGLSAPRGWDSDGNGTVDLLYAGDQLGNVWKFDLNDPDSSSWDDTDPLLLFTATDAAGNPQPISGGVSISIDPTSYNRWVLFGTGRLLNDDDLWNSDGTASVDIQSLYGIIDSDAAIGTRAANDDQSAINGLVQRTIKSTGSIDGVPVRSFESEGDSLLPDKRGWFVDLLTPPDGKLEGERVLGNAQVVGPVLIISSAIPSHDPCTPGGRGYINALNAFTGASVGEHFFDVDGDGDYSDDEVGGDPVGSVDTGVGMPTDGVLIDKLIGVGGSGGTTGSVGVNNPAASGRVSWREVLRK